MGLNFNVLVFTLHVNGLNITIKGYWHSEKKKQPNCAIYKKFTSNAVMWAGWNLKIGGKKYHASINQNNVGVAILISVETDFRAKKFTWHRETLHIEKIVNLPRRLTCIHHHRAVKHKAKFIEWKEEQTNPQLQSKISKPLSEQLIEQKISKDIN